MKKDAIIQKTMNLNFDTSSYKFSDIDLETAVEGLEARDREMIILYLMGHKQQDIAGVYNLDRSMISKRLKAIIRILTLKMTLSR